MKKLFLPVMSAFMLCACGGQKTNQATENTNDSADNQAAATEAVADAPVCNLDESEIKAKLKEKGYNCFEYEDIDHDGVDEILTAEYDPAEGGCIFKIGIFLKDKDLTCVAETNGDREDVGNCQGMVVKMNLDDEGKEHYEIFEINNSKVSPAPEGTMVPEYMSLTNYAIETWKNIDSEF